MRSSVRAAFVAFTAPLEGVVPWMYLDVKGLVTVAIGNLIDPIQYALPLPFVHPDGRHASRDEIAAEWLRVKADANLAKYGHRAAKLVTSLRLTDEGVDLVVSRKLAQNDGHLSARFPDWEQWPADAQLATLSMAWACGPAFRFPMLEAALRSRNWELAAQECTIAEAGNPGIVPRNKQNRILYRNADRVQAYHLDPDELIWPADMAARPPSTPILEEAPSTPVPPTIPDTSAARQTGTSEAMRELHGMPRVIIVDDSED